MFNRLRLRQRRSQHLIDCRLQSVVNLFLQSVDCLFVEDAFADQKHLHARNGIACGIALALNVGTIEFFVIRERVRVGTDHVRVHKRRSDPRAAMRHGARQGSVADDWIGAVNLLEMEVGKTRDQARNISARSLHLDRHRDRVAIVLD